MWCNNVGPTFFHFVTNHAFDRRAAFIVASAVKTIHAYPLSVAECLRPTPQKYINILDRVIVTAQLITRRWPQCLHQGGDAFVAVCGLSVYVSLSVCLSVCHVCPSVSRITRNAVASFHEICERGKLWHKKQTVAFLYWSGSQSG